MDLMVPTISYRDGCRIFLYNACRLDGIGPDAGLLRRSIALDAVGSESLKQLVLYWVELAKQTDGKPPRGALDPTDIPHLLRQVLMVDVQHEPLRFQHRLVGTQVVRSVGRDTTGQSVDGNMYRGTTGKIVESYAAVVSQRRPMHAVGTVKFSESHTLDAEVVLLPLFEGDRVIIIVAGIELDGVALAGSGQPPHDQPFEIHTEGPRPLRL